MILCTNAFRLDDPTLSGGDRKWLRGNAIIVQIPDAKLERTREQGEKILVHQRRHESPEHLLLAEGFLAACALADGRTKEMAVEDCVG
jgi:hypothetical protein